VEPNSSNGTQKSWRYATKRKFYVVTGVISTRGGGLELLNGETLFHGNPPIFVPPPGRRGFRDYPVAPVFLSDKKLGRTDWDFEGYCGYWLISDRMKIVLERVDPEAFAFLKCRVELPDGSDGPVHWLCDVVRVLDALDEERSKIGIGVADNGSKAYNFLGVTRLIFKEDAVGPHHVFRMKYYGAARICDEEMRRACKSAGLTGLRFVDSTKY
jgi:hypothetical protein